MDRKNVRSLLSEALRVGEWGRCRAPKQRLSVCLSCVGSEPLSFGAPVVLVAD